MHLTLRPCSPEDFETLYRIDRACYAPGIAYSRRTLREFLDVLESARRQGVGSALLAEAERELAAAGVRVVVLETATNNQPAVAFWQRHGYRIVALHPRYYLNRIDAYLMTKPLAPASGP